MQTIAMETEALITPKNRKNKQASDILNASSSCWKFRYERGLLYTLLVLFITLAVIGQTRRMWSHHQSGHNGIIDKAAHSAGLSTKRTVVYHRSFSLISDADGDSTSDNSQTCCDIASDDFDCEAQDINSFCECTEHCGSSSTSDSSGSEGTDGSDGTNDGSGSNGSEGDSGNDGSDGSDGTSEEEETDGDSVKVETTTLPKSTDIASVVGTAAATNISAQIETTVLVQGATEVPGTSQIQGTELELQTSVAARRRLILDKYLCCEIEFTGGACDSTMTYNITISCEEESVDE